MVRETIHAVDPDLLNQLRSGVLGRRQNWSAFYRLYRKKSAILRSFGMTFATPSSRPFGLEKRDPRTTALRLTELYALQQGALDSARETLFPLGRRKLGHKEAVRYLRELYLKAAYQELELEFGYILAQLAHLSLPTWCGGRIGLSFLWRMGWETIREIAANPAKILMLEPAPAAHPLVTSFSAGIFIEPQGVERLSAALTGGGRSGLIRLAGLKQIPLSEIEPALDLILEAACFAGTGGFGLLEAVGVLDEDSMTATV